MIYCLQILTINEKNRIITKPNKPLLSVLCHQQLRGCKPAPEKLIIQIYSYRKSEGNLI